MNPPQEELAKTYANIGAGPYIGKVVNLVLQSKNPKTAMKLAIKISVDVLSQSEIAIPV